MMMKRTTTISMLLAAATFGGVSTASLAAGIGNTSSDDMQVTLNKNQLVSVTSVNDIDFGDVADVAEAGLEGTDSVCVFSNTGAFELTLTSQNGTNGTSGFGMSNGTAELTYGVRVEQQAGGLGGFLSGLLGADVSEDAQSGTPIGGLESSAAETCAAGAENLDLTITVAAADFDSVPAGLYSDTLTVFVKPE